MSSLPVRPPRPADPWSDPRIVVPPASAWAAMSAAERDDVEERILAALDEYRQDQIEEAERARIDAEQARAEAERARAAAERERAAAEERLAAARAAVAERILRRLAERGLTVTEPQRAAILACEDFARLLLWLEVASSAATAEEILST